MSILVVDANYQIMRCLCLPDLSTLRNKDGEPTGGIFGFLRILKSQISSLHTVNKVLCCFDCGYDFRKSIYPDYKANRDYTKNPEDYKAYVEDKDEFGWSKKGTKDFQFNVLENILPKMNIRAIKLEGFEADDLVYKCCDYYNQLGEEIYVLSDDKDYLQLVSLFNNIKLIRPLANQIVDKDNFEELFGVSPEWFIIKKAMEGDGSDNIPSCKSGFGESSILALINRAASLNINPVTETSKLLNLAESADSWYTGGQSWRIKKFDSTALDNLLFNMKLVDFRLLPYKHSENVLIGNQINEKVSFNNLEVFNFIKKFEFKSLVDIVSSNIFKKLK